jgi:hypothetical protein
MKRIAIILAVVVVAGAADRAWRTGVASFSAVRRRNSS